MKKLSIVVASKNAQRTIGQCLDALMAQSQGDELEILVVDASTDGSADTARRYKGVTIIPADPAALTPELWKIGLDHATGEAVAFTTANFIPAGNWISVLHAALESKYAAIGGVFDKLSPDGLSQWAIYFLRYAAYLPSNAPHAASQLAADNAMYRRWVFEQYPELIEDGFWEHPVNRQLTADGHSLFLTPALKVSMGYFSSPVQFFGQRFQHGRMFGTERAQHASTLRRLIYLVTAPLIPFVLLMRVTRNALRGSVHKGKFFSSLPWILFYVLGWSAGELWGYLVPKPAAKKVRSGVSSHSSSSAVTRNKPLKTVLIGMGAGPEKILLPGLTSLPQIDLAAACDQNAETRDRVAGRWGIPKTYADANEMLEAEKPDLVVVGTPPKTHYQYSLLALEHGAHLFCEKPFMTSLAEADDVLARARQCQRWVGVNSQYYQMPIYRRLQSALDQNEVGRLYQIDAWQDMYLLPNEEGGWKADLMPRRVLLEFGTHAIDLICRFFGEYPEAVSARVASARKDIDADVCINVRLDFPGDRVANIVFNRMSYSPMRYFEMRLNCEKAALRVSLGGFANLELGWNSERRRPKLQWSFTRGGEARLERDGESKLLVKQQDAAYGAAASQHIASFARSIQQGGPPDATMEASRKLLQVLLACYESAENRGALVAI